MDKNGGPERFSLDADFLRAITQEGRRRLGHDMLDAQPRLQVLHKALHEAEEVVSIPDVAWHSLCSHTWPCTNTHMYHTHTHTHTHHTHFEQSWPWDLTQLKTYFFFFFFSLVLCIFCLEKGSTPKCCMESGVNSSFNSSSGVRGSIPLKNAFFTRTAQYKSYLLLLLLITFRVRALTSCPSSQMFSTRP